MISQDKSDTHEALALQGMYRDTCGSNTCGTVWEYGANLKLETLQSISQEIAFKKGYLKQSSKSSETKPLVYAYLHMHIFFKLIVNI